MYIKCLDKPKINLKELEQHIQEQIDELLSFKLDDSLIQQLETKSKQLDEIL